MGVITKTDQKTARRELRKAQTLDLLAEVLASQRTHGAAMNDLRDALAEHTLQQLRLSNSFWARLKWLAVGR